MPTRTHPRPPVAPAALNAGDAMWTNLGDWSRGDAYGDAAPALAQRVGEAAKLRPSDVVVDYACGYGDSLRLWIDRFDVRRVVGIEPDPNLCAIIESRIAAWGLRGRITVRQARAEDCAPRAVDADASAVVCVDAAYHFATRLAWWRMLAQDLGDGARIAASDLLLAPGRRVGLGLRGIAAAMRIPRENLVDADALRRALASLPLRGVAVWSCGEAVLDGFAAKAPDAAFSLRATKAAIRYLRRRAAVDYAIIGAECQSAGALSAGAASQA